MRKYYFFLSMALIASLLMPLTAKADDCRFTPDMYPGQASDRTASEVSVTVPVGSFGKCENRVSNVVDLHSTNNDVIWTSGGANNYYAVLAIHPGTAKVTYTENWFTGAAGEDGSVSTCSTNHIINYTVVKGTPVAQFVDGNTAITEYRVVQNAGFSAPTAQVITKAIKNASTYPEFRDVTIDPTQMTFTSSNTDVATIGRSNTVTLTNQVGETTITATWAGDSNWESVTISYKLIVEAETPVNPTLTFVDASGATVREAEATLGEEFTEPTLTCNIPEVLRSVTYSSMSERIAKVDTYTGDVTLVAAGTTSIVASFAGNNSYSTTRAVYTLVVKEASVTPTCPEGKFFSNGAEITSLTVQRGESVSIPMLLVATGSVIPTSNIRIESERIASVTEDGMIYGLAEGTTVLHVFSTSADGMTCEYTLTIVVEAAAQQKQDPELSLSFTEANIELGETFVRPDVINPHNIEFTERNSKWYTAWDSKVASVDEATGNVTILGVGDETITFEFTGSDDYNFAILTYTIHVTTTGLAVGGVMVTGSNKDDVFGDNGSIVYDPITHTLTMTNAIVNGTSINLAPARIKSAKAEDIDAAIRYTDPQTLTIVLVGSNAIGNADAGIYSEHAPVVIMASEDVYGAARIGGNTVAIKAEALKLYQCYVTAYGGVGVAVNELGVATGAHLVASGQGLAIQANNLVMAEDNNGEGIGILTAGVTFKQKSGFYNADGSVAAFVEIGKVVIPVPDDEETTIDFTLTDPEGNEAVIFSSTAQDRYNEETGQIELSSTLTDEQVENAVQTLFPGSTEWRESLPGSITFDIPAGQGIITIEGSVSSGYTLKLKMGDQPVVTVTKGETGEIVILYDTPATVHVVLYLQLDNSASPAPARIAAVATDEEPVVGATISSITITPSKAQAGVEEVEGRESKVDSPRKVLINGNLYILTPEGRTFDAQGKQVK